MLRSNDEVEEWDGEDVRQPGTNKITEERKERNKENKKRKKK